MALLSYGSMSRGLVLSIALTLLFASACEKRAGTDGVVEGGDLEGEPVTPPFRVAGEVEGLLLVWFDATGPHTASARKDIPLERRQHVRVDSLALAPEARLDSEWIYLTDLRTPAPDGSFPVRKVRRAAFDQAIERAQVGAEEPGRVSTEDVILYGAAWCGACRQAERYLRERGIPFVEKDIEKDPAARRELSEKARRAGIAASGIPVLDVGGTLVQGFDRAALERLLATRPQTL